VYWISAYRIYTATLCPVPKFSGTIPPIKVDDIEREYCNEDAGIEHVHRFLHAYNLDPAMYTLPGYNKGSIYFYVKDKKDITSKIFSGYVDVKIRAVEKIKDERKQQPAEKSG
jgi:hypothetical protein